MSKYRFIEDPGHGWLEVSLHELAELGLIDKISGYSYVSADRQQVYLEEDCDLSLFIEAKFSVSKSGSVGEIEEIGNFFKNEVENVHQENTFVRKLDHYYLKAA